MCFYVCDIKHFFKDKLDTIEINQMMNSCFIEIYQIE